MDSSKDTVDDDNIAPIIKKLKSKNKFNFTGDYLSSFEKNLIPKNKKMQAMFKKSILVSSKWFRDNCEDLILPENIDVVIGIFYTLPRCFQCGMFNNLWLNLFDGTIGCGRRQWDGTGGKGCALQHYALIDAVEFENHERIKYAPIVVKLGTIGKYGADVFDYNKDIMIMEALFVENDDDEKDSAINKNRNKRNAWTNDNEMCLDELQPLLAYWGIQMGIMYKFDKSMAEIEIESNADFINSNPWFSF